MQTNLGVKIMAYLAWDKMTDQEKFQFLHHWCTNLSNSLQQLAVTVQGLHDRLQVVEGKAAGTS
jgi:hypothetical protein